MSEEFIKYKDKLLFYLQKNSNQTFFPTFWNLKDDIERINFVHLHLEKYGILENTVSTDSSTKDDKAALASLSLGDKLRPYNDYRNFLKFRTKCVASAQSKEMLAKAYDARSEALFVLDLYQESIADIDRAFLTGCAEDLRPLLDERRNKSLKLLGTRMNIKPYENPPNVEECSNLTAVRKENCLLNGRNYVVATQDIQIGELISIEEPVAGTLAEENYYFYCHHCFALCYNPIPCGVCTQSLFCSEVCEQNAISDYHHIECLILHPLNKLMHENFGRLIPLRVLFTPRFQERLAISKLIEASHITYSYDMLFEMTVIGAVMYHLLKNRHTKLGLKRTTVEEEFKRIIIKYLLFCQNGLTDIPTLACYTNMADRDSLLLKNEAIALGIYTFRNMFRHSCCPNVHMYFCGTTMVFRAIRTIKKGEECFVSYGPRYASHELEERREKLLSCYGFICSCRACEQDWPQFDLLQADQNSHFEKQFAKDLRYFIVDMVNVAIKMAEMKVKQLEHNECCVDLYQQSKQLVSYYCALGNKKVFLFEKDEL